MVLTAEVEQDLRLRHSIHPAVMRQLHVSHDRAVPVAPLRRPQVHAHQPTRNHRPDQARRGTSCAHAFPRSTDTPKTPTSGNVNQLVRVCPSTAEVGRGGAAAAALAGEVHASHDDDSDGLLSELDEVTARLAARATDAPGNFLHLRHLVLVAGGGDRGPPRAGTTLRLEFPLTAANGDARVD